MLRKLSMAIAGTMLVSGVAVAAPLFAVQPVPTFPTSVNDTGPNYTAPTVARTLRAGTSAPTDDVAYPSSVSESMPEMTGGMWHPTMGTGATRALPRDADVSGTVQAPASLYPVIGD